MNSSLYKSVIVDNFKSPKNEGLLKEFTHEAKVANRSCGDEIHIQLLIKDGVIEDIGYIVTGCAVSVASMSMVSEKVKGMKVQDINKIDDKFIFEMMGIEETSGRSKCVLLSRDAVRTAIS